MKRIVEKGGEVDRETSISEEDDPKVSENLSRTKRNGQVEWAKGTKPNFYSGSRTIGYTPKV